MAFLQTLASFAPAMGRAQYLDGSRVELGALRYSARVEPAGGVGSVPAPLPADAWRSEGPRRWPTFLLGAVVGGLGGAVGTREICLNTASTASTCTPYAIAGGLVGALAGGFLALAIQDIVSGKT